MRSAIRSIPWLVTGALLCLTSGLFAQVNLQLNDPPSNNVLDGIYVGAYSATSASGQTQVICDDFNDESNYNQYSYNASSGFSTGNFTNTLWGGVVGAGKLYDEAAWLALGMLNQTGATQGYYSYAIWAVFASSSVASWLTNYGDVTACNTVFGSGSWGNSKCNVGSGGLLGSAAGQKFTAGEFSNLLILTPQGCKGSGSCPEQEFFEPLPVPEGGSAVAYLLLAGISCFGAMFYSRRRTAKGGLA